MQILRKRSFFYNKEDIGGAFLTRRSFFSSGCAFGRVPEETQIFIRCLKKKGYQIKKINARLLHLGEPFSIKELLFRQIRYGITDFNLFRFIVFCLTPLGLIAFLLCFSYYRKEKMNKKISSSFLKLSFLFAAFMAVFYWSALLMRIFKESRSS